MGDVMPNDKKNTALRIEKLPRGGYAVFKSYSLDSYNCPLAGFSDIDDALAFIKNELGEPEKTEPYGSASSLIAEQSAENDKREQRDKAEARIEAARHGGAAVCQVGSYKGIV
jgi:hypothetical protein